MRNYRIMAALAACFSLIPFTAVRAQNWTATKLTQFAVTNASGALVALGTPGFDAAHNPDKPFDGDTATFNDTWPVHQNAWAGYGLQTPKIVTRIRYIGRPDGQVSDRFIGVLFQGANTADFSDAVTLYSHVTPPGWNGTTWIDVTLTTTNALRAFTYLRFIATAWGSYGGNAGEVEFYGIDPLASAPTTPVMTFTGSPNWHANLLWTVAADALAYEVQRKRSDESEYTTLLTDFYKNTGIANWRDTQTLLADTRYRVRALNNVGASEWYTFTASARNAAVGTPFGASGYTPYTSDKLYDSDCETFLDTYWGIGSGDAPWAALDLGTPRTITGVRYTPRRIPEGWDGGPGRMVGGRFEAADNADFTGAVTLYTIPSAPGFAGMAEYALASPVGPYRYVRYVSPPGGWGNAGELEYDLAPEAPLAPSSLTITSALSPNYNPLLTNDYPVLTWTFASLNLDVGRVYRATSPGGPYTAVASGVSGRTWTDTGAQVGKLNYYKVCALDSRDGSEGPLSDAVSYRRCEWLERSWDNRTAVKPGMSLITAGTVNFGLGVDRMFDGDLSSFPDVSPGNSSVGVDLGKRYCIGHVRFSARAGLEYRANGAELRGSNSATLSPYTTLATFSGGVAGVYATVSTTSSEAFRYIFVTKDSGDFYGNITELELYGWEDHKGTLIQVY